MFKTSRWTLSFSILILIMEVSSVAKGSSDFSIARILGEGARGEDKPSWLCCTRYQPPKLPRPTTTGRSRRAGRHARVPFSAAQAAALEAAYTRAPYLAPPALRALAAALQLRDDRIKIWFQNRRARERREKCSTILPPNAVTLPPTPARLQHRWTPSTSTSIVTTGERDSDMFLHRSPTNEEQCLNEQKAEEFESPSRIGAMSLKISGKIPEPQWSDGEDPTDIGVVDIKSETDDETVDIET